jgi:hypothetical protein
LPNEHCDCPEVLWFIKLRESVDVEAELYTYMEVAATKELLQIGFDETKINGQSTNLWLLIEKKDIKTKVWLVSLLEAQAMKLLLILKRSYKQKQV